MHYIPCRAHSLNLVGVNWVNAIELGSKVVGDFLPCYNQYIHFAQPQQVDGEKCSGIRKWNIPWNRCLLQCGAAGMIQHKLSGRTIQS